MPADNISSLHPELPRYKTIWISDVHLGSAGCKAHYLAEFLKHNECDKLYLVGDIIDGWRIKSKFFWPQEHTNVIRRVLTKAKRGTEVIYVTGNHDEFLRKFVGYDLQLGNIKIVNEAIHTTADGRKLLITHGDLFDVITRYHAWVAKLGSVGYEGLLKINNAVNTLRQKFGLPYWSVSAIAKKKVKSAANFVNEFEVALAAECARRQLNGVVCGHIHQAEIRNIGSVQYHNCGDWVESCTALAEDQAGNIEIIDWTKAREQVLSKPADPDNALAVFEAA